jgi:hypothetical protein
MREKFLQLLGKFFDWLMKRKAKNPNAGRPTLDDPSLIAQRTVINDMFSCWWGEVGWQIVRATTREELRAALEPLKDHPDKNRINRLLLASTVSADGEEIREARDANGRLIEKIYEAQDKQRACMDALTQAQMALGQATSDTEKILKAEISKRQAALDAANNEHRMACEKQEQFQKGIDRMEAGYAQDELLMFIDKRFIKGKYGRNPRNLADAMAGLPFAYGVHFLGVWQSYARCSKLDCQPHPRFQQFETIQSIWKKSRKSKHPVLEFFHEQISALPKSKKVKKNDPITGEEFDADGENPIRAELLKFWPIWKLAIQRSLETSIDEERVPYLICANFTVCQRDPKSPLYMVLGEIEKAKS